MATTESRGALSAAERAARLLEQSQETLARSRALLDALTQSIRGHQPSPPSPTRGPGRGPATALPAPDQRRPLR